MLEQAFKDIMEVRMHIGYARKEPGSLIYIIEGDGMVYDPDKREILLRLGKGHIFGESRLTKSVSRTTIGEIRSGLRPMNTLEFSYYDIERICTLKEQEKMRSSKLDVEVLK